MIFYLADSGAPMEIARIEIFMINPFCSITTISGVN